MQAHIDKINEMASVMRKAIEVDEERICEDEERIKQLEVKAEQHYFSCSKALRPGEGTKNPQKLQIHPKKCLFMWHRGSQVSKKLTLDTNANKSHQ